MSLISVNNLSISLGHTLFDGFSFTLNKGDRVGLVAANGRGKSSLLRCLAGLIDPTAGEVTKSRGLHIGWVEQDVPPHLLPLSLRDAVLSNLAADIVDYESWRADVALDELDVPYELRDTPMQALSGGWQRVALLARVWIEEPDVLLLDEPTNHLDLQRIGILQKWLTTTAKRVSIIVASHDRAFLDEVTNRTVFLRATGTRDFASPYSDARAALATMDQADEARFQNVQKQAQQLQRQATKLKNIGINSGSDLLLTKTKQLSERAEKLKATASAAHKETSSGTIQLRNSGTHAKALVSFENTRVSTPDGQLLYRVGEKWINKGDRIALLGGNGTGKTQLVRRVAVACSVGDSAIRAAGSVLLGYCDQNQSQLDDKATPFEQIAAQFDIGDQNARSLLAGAGIGIDLQSSALSALSGGQRMRLAMLVLRLTQPNFFLLDEPTNHLDIEGQEALEDELKKDGISCLLVSHDRRFVQNTANRFWQIKGRQLEEVDDPDAFFEGELNS